VNTSRLNPSWTRLYSIYLPRSMEGWVGLSGYIVHTEMVYLPIWTVKPCPHFFWRQSPFSVTVAEFDNCSRQCGQSLSHPNTITRQRTVGNRTGDLLITSPTPQSLDHQATYTTLPNHGRGPLYETYPSLPQPIAHPKTEASSPYRTQPIPSVGHTTVQKLGSKYRLSYMCSVYCVLF